MMRRIPVAIAALILALVGVMFRLAGGDVAVQFVAVQGPTPKDVAVTGGTGAFRNVAGDGSVVEFGDGTGRCPQWTR
jgi:hypothetical protein